MKKKLLIAGMTAGALVAGGLLWLGHGRQTGTTSSSSSANSHEASAIPVVDVIGLSGFDDHERAIIHQLRNKYGSHIAGIALQVQVIGNLMDLLQKLYPADWEGRLLRILAAAFPQQIAELRDRYDALSQYNAWLKDVLPQLNFPDQASRRQALWDKRLAIFGEAAYDIWAIEHREEKLAATLKQLATSTAPLQEKSATYISSLKETYGDHITGPDAPHVTQNMTRFLSLDSVQKDLRGLPVEQRESALRSFRKDMGLDDAALQRWDQLDAERDTVRNTGNTYMTERARLETQYRGQELEQKISRLQNQLFGEAEAQFIRNEEASGHFRFKTQQSLGVN